ncbi:chromosome transmission fidelity protein 18 homolog isoform X1 [Chenopodium quinoa]|uniref:chromosome transmission fidelity protein 18 homolog isoform X1 n=1 Tax=Chenopodium quinoa TaxID=63459 RepID=UPI000B7702B0|nr:chromosome transmission fidelity protein 18 homolog isoform X1 [Chenopodium quinoa]
MEFPDLDELQWLEVNQQEEEEEYSVELEVEEDKFEIEDAHYESEEAPPSPHRHSQSRIQIASNDKKRPRSPLDTDYDECVRVRVRTEIETPDVSIQLEKHDNGIYLSRFASEIDGNCVPITAPSGSGERVYAKLDRHTFSVGDDNVVKKSNMPATSSGLISESVCVLLQNAEQDALLKALQSSSEVQDTLSPESSVMTEELWVNKYAPRSFTELLSDEQTNREVLSWLKQWDAAVFGNGIRNTEDEVLSALRRHSSLPLHQKHSSASFPGKSRGPKYAGKYTETSSNFEQENNRPKVIDNVQNTKQNSSRTPDQKVLLLCGPPGLGKTTLAHVAAKHCGYHVVEINASDDRSSTTIEAKILDAVQMNSVMAHSKPKCLVIDEIDGALGDGKGAVEVILKMVAAEKKSYVGNEASIKEERYERKSLSRGRKVVSLSRPIICICNDLYAPSLRSLRHVAKVHVFSQPTLNRVVNRLKYICSREGMKTSSIALTALAECTECDIRSCLNTIQFLHKKKESLNLVALSSQVIGRKDMTRSIFDVWKEVFQKRKPKQSRACDINSRKSYDANEFLYSLVSYRSDNELIFDGIHENFLQLRYHDPMLQKTVHCLDTLGVSDLLHQYVLRSHNMSLSVYYPSLTITIHQLLARVETPSIEWPKSFQRYRSLLMEKLERLRSWQSKIAPCISRHVSANSFVEDTISPLLHILSPADVRPVAVQLLSDKEKTDLAQLIGTMVLYSLTYKNTKSDSSANKSVHDGLLDAVSFSMDPPISGFVNFKGYKPGHYELASAVKQLLTYEVEKHKIVQESIAKSMHSTDSIKLDNNAARDGENGRPKSSKMHEAPCDYSNEGITMNKSQKDFCKPNIHRSTSPLGFGGSAADVKKPSFGSFNFFDRFKKIGHKSCHNVDSLEERLANAERDGHHLLFKFNEGFTNAVKRPVRIREFLR